MPSVANPNQNATAGALQALSDFGQPSPTAAQQFSALQAAAPSRDFGLPPNVLAYMAAAPSYDDSASDQSVLPQAERYTQLEPAVDPASAAGVENFGQQMDRAWYLLNTPDAPWGGSQGFAGGGRVGDEVWECLNRLTPAQRAMAKQIIRREMLRRGRLKGALAGRPRQ